MSSQEANFFPLSNTLLTLQLLQKKSVFQRTLEKGSHLAEIFKRSN